MRFSNVADYFKDDEVQEDQIIKRLEESKVYWPTAESLAERKFFKKRDQEISTPKQTETESESFHTPKSTESERDSIQKDAILS